MIRLHTQIRREVIVLAAGWGLILTERFFSEWDAAGSIEGDLTGLSGSFEGDVVGLAGIFTVALSFYLFSRRVTISPSVIRTLLIALGFLILFGIVDLADDIPLVQTSIQSYQYPERFIVFENLLWTMSWVVMIIGFYQALHEAAESARELEQRSSRLGRSLRDEELANERYEESEERLNESNKMLHALYVAQSTYISSKGPKKPFGQLLDAVLELTGSSYGFIGEVLQDSDHKPYLKTHAITNIAWNEETRKLYDAHSEEGMEFHNMETLFGRAITSGRPVISNNPRNDIRRAGTPDGHPPLDSFLGLPFFRGTELIGMVGIANRAGGYNENVVSYLEPFLATCANLVQAYRSLYRRVEAEKEVERIASERQQILVNLEKSRVEAEAANIAKSEFIAHMSHDIRTPITSIIGYADLLTEPQGRATEDVYWAQRILKSANHLRRLLDDLLDLSRIEAGRLRIVKAPVNLHDLLEEVVTLYESQAREKLLNICLKIDARVPRGIRTDETRLRQIMINLVSNAVKFTREGTINIEVDVTSEMRHVATP